jgi:ABC-type antimicrobial peptide transport system permease subunit
VEAGGGQVRAWRRANAPHHLHPHRDRPRLDSLSVRATSWLIATFSTVAIPLAVAGTYGIVSYTVGDRPKEISIRMAMGAQNLQVVRRIVRQGMTLVMVGVGLGLLGAWATAGPFSNTLLDVSATDLRIYVFVAAPLLRVAMAANYLTARRAARVAPMAVLRRE